MARCVALVFNWWNLFVRLADPDHHREAITCQPLLLQAVGRQTKHAGRTTVTIASAHGNHQRATGAYAYRCVFHRTTKDCGAVDCRRALVSDPQPSPDQVIFAPLVAYSWFSAKPYARRAAVAWNLFGMADLVNAVALGAQTGAGGGGIAFPIVLIPVYAVPRAFLIHSFSLIGLLPKSSRSPKSTEVLHYRAAPP
jgi:hypothetical protein